MEEVLHLLDAGDFSHPGLKLLDQFGRVDLAAQEDRALLGVDTDLPLGNLGVAEEDRLDLVRERRVVRLLFGLRPQAMDDAARSSLDPRSSDACGAAELPKPAPGGRDRPVACEVAAEAASVAIEEVGDAGTKQGAREEREHEQSWPANSGLHPVLLADGSGKAGSAVDKSRTYPLALGVAPPRGRAAAARRRPVRCALFRPAGCPREDYPRQSAEWRPWLNRARADVSVAVPTKRDSSRQVHLAPPRLR